MKEICELIKKDGEIMTRLQKCMRITKRRNRECAFYVTMHTRIENGEVEEWMEYQTIRVGEEYSVKGNTRDFVSFDSMGSAEFETMYLKLPFILFHTHPPLKDREKDLWPEIWKTIPNHHDFAELNYVDPILNDKRIIKKWGKYLFKPTLVLGVTTTNSIKCYRKITAAQQKKLADWYNEIEQRDTYYEPRDMVLLQKIVEFTREQFICGFKSNQFFGQIRERILNRRQLL